MKTASKILIAYFSAVFIIGCALQTPLLDWEPDRGSIAITKPPMQIIVRSDVDKEEEAFIMRVIDKMSTLPFQDYKFNEKTELSINSVSGKTDSVAVEMKDSIAFTESDTRGHRSHQNIVDSMPGE